jgi:hypothetical protein
MLISHPRDPLKGNKRGGLHVEAPFLSPGFRARGLREDRKNHEFAFRKSFALEQSVERFNDKLPIFVEARMMIYAWREVRAKMRNDHL